MAKKKTNGENARNLPAGRKRGPKPGVHAAKKIKDLPILDDVHTWIRSGLPATKVAQRIQDQGYCEDMDRLTLAKQVRTFARKVMSPGEVAVVHNPQLVLEAQDKILKGLDELGKIEGWVGGLEKLVMSAMGLLSDEDQPPVKQPLAVMGTDAYADFLKTWDKLIGLVRESAKIKVELGVLGVLEDKDSDASRDVRLAEMIHKHWPGNKTMWSVLMDDGRRRKVLKALEMITSDQKMLDEVPDDE
jgi:hypothetical protein